MNDKWEWESDPHRLPPVKVGVFPLHHPSAQERALDKVNIPIYKIACSARNHTPFGIYPSPSSRN